jgi:hypothetical protein
MHSLTEAQFVEASRQANGLVRPEQYSLAWVSLKEFVDPRQTASFVKLYVESSKMTRGLDSKSSILMILEQH